MHTSAPGTSRPAPEARRASPFGSVALVLALVVLVPLITGTALLKSAGKLIGFEVLGALLLAQVLVRARPRGGIVRLKAAALAGPNLPLLLLVGLAGASCFLSPFRAFAAPEFLRIAFCALLYFVLVYQTDGRAALQMLCDGILLAAAAVSLTGLAEMGTEGLGGQVVTGSFGTHELLGSFLMLLLPLALALGLINRGDPKRQLAAQIVALLVVACLLTARTRSAWIGGGVSLLVLMALSLRYTVKTNRGGWPALLARRKSALVGPALGLALAVGVFLAMSPLGPSLGQRAATLSHAGIDGSFQQRLVMWRGAGRLIAQRPLLGWGVGSYPVREATFTGIGAGQADVLARGADLNNVAHSFYLQTAAELGLVGLGLYLTIVALFFAAGLRALPALERGLRKTVLIGSLAAMAGQLVDAASSPAYNFASVSLFQWLLMGLGMYAAGLPARERSRAADAASDALPGASPEAAPVFAGWARAGLRYASAGVAVVFLGGLIEPTVHAAFADGSTPLQDCYTCCCCPPVAPRSSSYSGTRDALYAAAGAGAVEAGAKLIPRGAPALLAEAPGRYDWIRGQGSTLADGATFRFRVDPKDNEQKDNEQKDNEQKDNEQKDNEQKDNEPHSINPSFFQYEEPGGFSLVSSRVTSVAFTGPYEATFKGIGYLSDNSKVRYTVSITGDRSEPDAQRLSFTVTRLGQPGIARDGKVAGGGYEFLHGDRVQWANPSGPAVTASDPKGSEGSAEPSG